MNRRHFAAMALTVPLAGCYQPGTFDLKWEEELLLADGQVVTVGITHTYMRMERSWTEFGGLSSVRKTTLSLDTKSSMGVVTQVFMGFRPMFLGQKDGVWYAVLIGGYVYKNRLIPGQDWGDKQGPYGQWPIRLVSGKWQSMPFAEFPKEFVSPNMILLYAPASEMAQFHGKRVTLADKADWYRTHPPGYADVQITGPKADPVPTSTDNRGKKQ